MMALGRIEGETFMELRSLGGPVSILAPPKSSAVSSALQMICSLSNTILQATELDLEDAIRNGLGTIGQFMEVDSAYLFLYSDSADRVEKTFEWDAKLARTPKGRFSGMRLCPFTYTLGMSHANQPMVLGSIDELPMRAKPEKLLWAYMGTQSLLGNPLHIQDTLIGYFGLTSKSRPRNWSEEEITLSRFIASVFANALNRFRSEKRLREAKDNELAIAAEIQRSLLSPTPIPTSYPLKIGIASHPSLSVDGDFIDIFQNANGSIDLIMGDSMGKGVPAALLSAATKIALLRARAVGWDPNLHREATPGDILRKVQEEIGAKMIDMSAFVTLAFARYVPKWETLQVINAGHPTILIWRQATGSVECLFPQNPPIGLLSPDKIIFQETRLESGDVMVIYSDGLIDARNPEGKFFGVQRVMEILQSVHYLPPQEIAERLYRLCLTFIGKEQFHDDFSCLVASIP